MVTFVLYFDPEISVAVTAGLTLMTTGEGIRGPIVGMLTLFGEDGRLTIGLVV